MDRALIVIGLCLLASGCAIRCNEATFHRYEAVSPGTDITATPLMGGGVRLETKTGLFLDFSSCWLPGATKNADLCLEIRVPKERRFQFLDTEFIALNLNGKAATSVKLESINYSKYCSVPPPSRSLFSDSKAQPISENFCQSGKSLVSGPVQFEEKLISLPGDATLISCHYSFEPSLKFHGAEAKTMSFCKEMKWQSYQTTVLRDLRIGSDFILAPLRIAIDGKEMTIPRINVKTVTDQLCGVRELM